MKPKPDPSGFAAQKGAGGFVDFPTATYQPDAASDRSYVASSKAWLPAPPQLVGPDQLSYVQTEASGGSSLPTTLYVVDVRTRTKRLVFTASDSEHVYPLDYSAAGVVVMLQDGPKDKRPPDSTMDVIDPVTGSHKTVRGTGAAAKHMIPDSWFAVSGNAIWGWVTEGPSDNHSPASRKLIRVSLQDGTPVEWHRWSPTSESGSEQVLGFDADDNPIVAILPKAASGNSYPVPQLVLLKGPNRAIAIHTQGGTFKPQVGLSRSYQDRYGTWFAAVDGSIWLYTESGEFMRVAVVPPRHPRPTAGYDFGARSPVDVNPDAWRSIAGPCV